MFDRDGPTAKSAALEKAINSARNAHTRAIDAFDQDLETFLALPKGTRPDRKPQFIMWHLQHGKIAPGKLKALIAKVQPLLDA